MHQDWKLECASLGIPLITSSEAPQLLKCFEELLNRVGVPKEKFTHVAIDQGANYQKAFRKDWPALVSVTDCICHLLNHVGKDLCETPYAVEMVSWAKTIAKYFKKSCKATT